MSFSNLLERVLLNHTFSHGNFLLTYTPPTIYLGLWVGDPGEDGVEGSEVDAVDTGYVRLAAADWSIATGTPTMIYNASVITFPEATTDWGEVTHFGILNALTEGSFLMAGMLWSPQNIIAGSIPSFPVGAIEVSLD